MAKMERRVEELSYGAMLAATPRLLLVMLFLSVGIGAATSLLVSRWMAQKAWRASSHASRTGSRSLLVE